MAGDIRICPRCRPAVIRRLDGSRITGWLPLAEYVGFLMPPRHVRVNRPPRACPNCGSLLVKREG